MEIVVTIRRAVVDARNDAQAAEEFVARLRNTELMCNSTFVYIVESNYGGHIRAAGILKGMERHGHHYSMRTEVDGIYQKGVWVTDVYKERFVQFNVDLLESDRFRIHDPLVADGERGVTMLMEQMRNMRRIHTQSQDSAVVSREQKFSYHYSGKGRGLKDDLCVALMECTFYFSNFMRDPKLQAAATGIPSAVSAPKYSISTDGLTFYTNYE